MLPMASFVWALLISQVSAAQMPLIFGPAGPVNSLKSPFLMSEWNLDEPPNANATGNLIFETVGSLLQRWPNTRMRNGHTVVPGTIPTGTLLYHGTHSNQLPVGPEWTATDPEHSTIFCRGPTREECWHATLATTRSLRIVYFDGSSAAKTEYGTMDTQDLIAWGEIRPEWVYNEKERIEDLCKWAEDHGVDGFVRMEMDFEVMLCSLTAGLRVVTFSNIANSWPSRRSFPKIPADSSTILLHAYEVVNAGSWHNRFPGEMRVHLDLQDLVSFYDTDLIPSLVPFRAGQQRWDHRVQNISDTDILAARARLTDALNRPENQSSGVDWMSLIRVIVDRHAQRLELIQYLLNSTATDPADILDIARKTQTQLRVMLSPYILYTATPSTGADWAVPVFKLCATTHTSSIEINKSFMTPSEQLLLRSIQETTREICRVTTKMWASGVVTGVDDYLEQKESPDIAKVSALLENWREAVNALMEWLDWSVWVKCKPSCGFEEMCYLPTWPIGFPPPSRAPRTPHPRDIVAKSLSLIRENTRKIRQEKERGADPGTDDWLRPQPKCIRRVAPYGF
ncbi:hypothetical protein F5I97DRAFT_1469050 [Phlebopus sp. FC_14]|nr:hypothetical protein F5I97DRAFT_1469050 [Phlebopus sp. FC_14]